MCWFVYVIRVENRDAILEKLTEQGIGCARYFAPLHRQPLFAPYANPRDDLKITEQVASQTLALPFFNRLTREQIHEVCCALAGCGSSQNVKKMSLDAPSPAFSGRVVDDKPVLDGQAGCLCERTKLTVSKDVPSRGASHFVEIPSDYDISIRLVPAQTIAQKAKGGWNRAVVARIVAVLHVYEDPALGRHQTCKLTENLQAAGWGKDVSQDIPETRDDVKLASTK